MVKDDYKPAEQILLSTPIGLDSLGAKFRVEAPFTACRLCGDIVQTDQDRLCKDLFDSGRIVEHYNALTGESHYTGDSYAIRVLDESTEYRIKWREAHERKFHTEEEIKLLHKSGFALTPEAAHKLAPYGITPLGVPHGDSRFADEIADALFTAPRAPVDDAED